MTQTPAAVVLHRQESGDDIQARASMQEIRYYNFVKVHKTLRVPAMQAGLSETVMTFEDLAQIVDDVTPKPGPRGPYKKRVA